MRAFFIALLLLVAAAADAARLRVGSQLGVDGFWNGTDPSTVDGGYEWAIATRLAQVLGYEGIEVVVRDQASVLSGAVTDYDVYLNQLPIPRGTGGAVVFTRPYLRVERGVLVRAGTVVASVVASRALRWGALSGRTAVTFVQKKVKPTTPVTEFADVSSMVTALVGGTIDAAMLDTVSVLRIAQDSGGTVTVAGQIKSGGVWGIVLPRGSALKPRINKLLRLGEKTGILPALRTEWLVPALGADPQLVPVIPKR
jgi:polar amino acid transport system substrate-binding protein